MRMNDIQTAHADGEHFAHSPSRDADPATDFASLTRVKTLQVGIMRDEGDKGYDPEQHAKYVLADAQAGKADDEQQRRRKFSRRADGVLVVACDEDGNPVTRRVPVRDADGVPTGEVEEREAQPFVARTRELKATWSEAVALAAAAKEAAKHRAAAVAQQQAERAERQRQFVIDAEALLAGQAHLLTRHGVERGEQVLASARAAEVVIHPQGIHAIDGWPVLVTSQTTADDAGLPSPVTPLRPDTPDAVIVRALMDLHLLLATA